MKPRLFCAPPHACHDREDLARAAVRIEQYRWSAISQRSVLLPKPCRQTALVGEYSSTGIANFTLTQVSEPEGLRDTSSAACTIPNIVWNHPAERRARLRQPLIRLNGTSQDCDRALSQACSAFHASKGLLLISTHRGDFDIRK
jgi:hypothetical protein